MAKMVGVHIAGKFVRYETKEDARQMVKRGDARWIPGSCAIEAIQNVYSKTSRIAQPGNRTTELYAEGCKATQEAVNARQWRAITNAIEIGKDGDKDRKVAPEAYPAQCWELQKIGIPAYPVSEKEQVAIEAGLNRANQISKNAGWEMPFTGMRRLPHGSWGIGTVKTQARKRDESVYGRG